jgi:hypothetical protein
VVSVVFVRGGPEGSKLVLVLQILKLATIELMLAAKQLLKKYPP